MNSPQLPNKNSSTQNLVLIYNQRITELIKEGSDLKARLLKVESIMNKVSKIGFYIDEDGGLVIPSDPPIRILSGDKQISIQQYNEGWNDCVISGY